MATSSNDKKNNSSYPPPQNPPPGGYSGGASYPYSSPPPPLSSYPTTFYQVPATTFTYQQSPDVARSFLCGFLSVITAIATLFGFITLIGYFVLKPRIPVFHVNSASFTSFNFTSSDLTAKWDITLIVSNPNKKLDITYEAVAASVFYGDNEDEYDLLATTRLAPFHQPTQSKAMIHVQFEVLNEFVDSGVAIGIAEGRVHGFVQFGVVLKALIKLNGLFHPSDHLLKFTCKPLNFGIPSSNINNVTWELLGGVACE